MATDRNVDRVRLAYESIAGRLWRSILAFSGSTVVADDAVAEAFAQVLRRGDAVVDVERWVWRAAFAVAKAELASRGRSAQALDDHPSDPDGALVELLASLAALPVRDRELLVLRYIGGWTPTELAGLFGVSAASVRVRMHRARAKARPLFEEEM